MIKLRLYLQNHPKLHKTLIFTCIIFISCFSFPFRNSRIHLDFWRTYSLIVGYGVVGLGFLGIYGEGKEKFVYILSVILTGIGLICRYFLEYGEVSNIRNFTLFNIISFLVIIPIYIACAYRYLAKHLIN